MLKVKVGGEVCALLSPIYMQVCNSCGGLDHMLADLSSMLATRRISLCG